MLTFRKFLRGLVKHAVTGDGENPLVTLSNTIRDATKDETSHGQTFETTAEEAPSSHRADELRASTEEARSQKARSKVET